MSKTIALRPRLNEKTYGLAASRVYVFDVDRGVNKHGIARAVEAQFDVKVISVNTTNIAGKAKRIVSITGKRMKNAEGSRSDIKKAYVTLAEGNSLPFFNAIEEEEQKEQEVQEKVDKAAAKQASKAAKETEKESKPRRGFRLPKKSKTEEDDK
jgi:large subunit ribosomal protein L23